MGILVFYEGDGRIAGDIPAEQWQQIRRLIPLAVDLINIEMRKPHTPPAPPKLQPAPFKPETIFRDEAVKKEEINVLNADELKRLFAWWDYLSPLVPPLSFYAEVMKILRAQTRHPNESNA